MDWVDERMEGVREDPSRRRSQGGPWTQAGRDRVEEGMSWLGEWMNRVEEQSQRGSDRTHSTEEGFDRVDAQMDRRDPVVEPMEWVEERNQRVEQRIHRLDDWTLETEKRCEQLLELPCPILVEKFPNFWKFGENFEAGNEKPKRPKTRSKSQKTETRKQKTKAKKGKNPNFNFNIIFCVFWGPKREECFSTMPS
jgi:hypothetical protein